MLLQIKDILEARKSKGCNWPPKSMIYTWNFYNFLGFRERCIKKLGRKLLIDSEAFEAWLADVAKEAK